jgi:hypothetical protein
MGLITVDKVLVMPIYDIIVIIMSLEFLVYNINGNSYNAVFKFAGPPNSESC